MSYKTVAPTFVPSLALSLILTSFNPTLAENIANQTDDPTIIVTATRTAATVDETLFPVSIITAEDITRMQATSLRDVLQTRAGISFSSNGGLGSISNIKLRGTNSNHTLLVIDGVPLYSATSGSSAFEYLPLATIERIEIVRGSRSSLYGSNAIGGVIQIFTKKNGSRNNSGEVSLGYGSNRTKEFNSQFTVKNKHSELNAGLSLLNSNGYDFLGRDSYGVLNSGDKDNDGFENYSLSLNARHQLNQKLYLSGLLYRSKGDAEYDGYSDSTTKTGFIEQIVSVGLDFHLNEQVKSKLSMSRSDDHQENYLHQLATPNTYFVDAKTLFNTTSYHLNWQNEVEVRESDLLTFGVDYKDDHVESSTSYVEKSRSNKAIYAQYQYYGEKLDVQLAMRSDKNQSFGLHNTWSVGTGYSINDLFHVTASYGTAFKAPTFNDLYWPGDAFFAGNSLLKPEKSKTIDLGFTFNYSKSQLSFNYYRTEIDELIDYVNAYPAVSMMQNISTAKIKGAELTLQTEMNGWLFNAELSITDPIDASTGLNLSQRNKRLLAVSLDKKIERINYGLTWLASSGRYNKSGERDYLAGYSLVNVRVAWDVNKNWAVKAKVDNLFDRDYALTKDSLGNVYNQPKRFISASVHYVF